MSTEVIPLCRLRPDKDSKPCGLPMFRIGVDGKDIGIGTAWVCENCDKIDRDKSIDSPLSES